MQDQQKMILQRENKMNICTPHLCKEARMDGARRWKEKKRLELGLPPPGLTVASHTTD